MGKRSNFKRRARDTYDTPFEAVVPLLPHLTPGLPYLELCAGAHDLVDHLSGHLDCVAATDIVPRDERVFRMDALDITAEDVACTGARLIVTNLPWDRSFLHAAIPLWSSILPCWLLFDADWIHTAQAAPYLWRLRRVVSVGRVKWIAGSDSVGKDNVAWHLFDATGRYPSGPAEFFGRGLSKRYPERL